MICHSTSMPTSFISGTSVYRISATPPPNAVAEMCTTRAPFSGSASARISAISSRPKMWV
jgi:hypothetical protein